MSSTSPLVLQSAMRDWEKRICLRPMMSTYKSPCPPVRHEIEWETNISAFDSWCPSLVPFSSSPPWEREKHICLWHMTSSTSPLVLQSAMRERECNLSAYDHHPTNDLHLQDGVKVKNINWLRLMTSTYQSLGPGNQIFELGVQTFLLVLLLPLLLHLHHHHHLHLP